MATGDLNKIECSFVTERLRVEDLQSQFEHSLSEKEFAGTILEILSPNVTKSLPTEWQEIDDIEAATTWLHQMLSESIFLTIQERTSNEIIGFIFLFEASRQRERAEFHIGYLLGENYWGQGYGNEFLGGLVNWAESSGNVSSLRGGVDVDNSSSIRLLEKNGFRVVNSEESPENVIFLERTFDR